MLPLSQEAEATALSAAAEPSAAAAPVILGQFRNERCCIRCEEASSPELGQVMRCRSCLNAFHPGCLATEELPPAEPLEEEKWRCPDCLAGIHPCFICKLSEGEMVATAMEERQYL